MTSMQRRSDVGAYRVLYIHVLVSSLAHFRPPPLFTPPSTYLLSPRCSNVWRPAQPHCAQSVVCAQHQRRRHYLSPEPSVSHVSSDGTAFAYWLVSSDMWCPDTRFSGPVIRSSGLDTRSFIRQPPPPHPLFFLHRLACALPSTVKCSDGRRLIAALPAQLEELVMTSDTGLTKEMCVGLGEKRRGGDVDLTVQDCWLSV